MSEIEQSNRFTELIRDSLLADIKMGAYNGRIHGGNFAYFAKRDPRSASELFFEFLETKGLNPEEFPTDINSIADELFWDTQHQRQTFVDDHTPAAQGGSLIRHNGHPTSSAAELAEFFDDLEAFRRDYPDPLGPIAE